MRETRLRVLENRLRGARDCVVEGFERVELTRRVNEAEGEGLVGEGDSEIEGQGVRGGAVELDDDGGGGGTGGNCGVCGG